MFRRLNSTIGFGIIYKMFIPELVNCPEKTMKTRGPERILQEHWRAFSKVKKEFQQTNLRVYVG
jgi:hypothetical protein